MREKFIINPLCIHQPPNKKTIMIVLSKDKNLKTGALTIES